MKYVLLFIVVLWWIPRDGYSQTIHYNYTFDASGNRTYREKVITYPKSAKLPKDSLSSPQKDKVGEVYNDLLDNKEIKIYPNPTRGLLTVDIPLRESDRARISIFDMQGRTLMDFNNAGTSTDIDLSGQPAGMYLLRIFINNKPTTWKIIKQD